MSSLCPYCPFEAAEGKGGHVRTDSVRRHVQLRHPAPIWDYVDAGGFTNRKVSPTLIIKTRVRGNKTDLNYGFCTQCHTSIKIGHLYNNAVKERTVLAHSCREKATRERRVPADPTKPRKPKAEFDVYKFMKKLGADDYCEFKEDLDIDMDKTLRNMVRLIEAKKETGPVTASIVERVKAEKSLRGWDIEKDVEEAKETFEDDYDEFENVLLPMLKSAVNSDNIRMKQHQVMEGLRLKIDNLEAELENAKIQLRLAQPASAFVDPRFAPRDDSDSEHCEDDDDGDVIQHISEIVMPEPKNNTPPTALLALRGQPTPTMACADTLYSGY